jgi:hypothetical protein
MRKLLATVDKMHDVGVGDGPRAAEEAQETPDRHLNRVKMQTEPFYVFTRIMHYLYVQYGDVNHLSCSELSNILSVLDAVGRMARGI